MFLWPMLAACVVTLVESGDLDVDLPFLAECSADICDLDQSVTNHSQRLEGVERELSAHRLVLLTVHEQLFDNATSEALKNVIGQLDGRLEQQEAQVKVLAGRSQHLSSQLDHVGDNVTAELGQMRGMVLGALQQADARSQLREKSSLEKISQLEKSTAKRDGDLETAVGKVEASVETLREQMSRASAQADENQSKNDGSFASLSTRVARAEAEVQHVSDNVTLELGKLRAIVSGSLEQAETKGQLREESTLEKIAHLEKAVVKNKVGVDATLGEVKTSVNTLQEHVGHVSSKLVSNQEKTSGLIEELSARVERAEDTAATTTTNLNAHVQQVDSDCKAKIKQLSDNMQNTNTNGQQKIGELTSQLQIAERSIVTKLNLLVEKARLAEKEIDKKIEDKYNAMVSAEKKVDARLKEINAKLRVAEENNAQQLATLRDQVQAAENRVTSKLQELNNHLQTVEKEHKNKLDEQNVAFNNVVAQVGGKINHFTNKIQEMEKQLNAKSQQFSALIKQQDTALHSWIQKQNSQLQEAQTKQLETIQENHKNLQIKLSEEKTHIQELSNVARQAETELQSLQQQEARVNIFVQEHERKIRAVISDGDAKLKSFLTQVESTKTQATAVVNDANTKLQRIKIEIQNTNTDVVNTKHLGEKLATDVKGNEQKLKQLQRSLEQSNKKTQEVATKVQQVQDTTATTIQKLEGDLKSLDTQLTILQVAAPNGRTQDTGNVQQQPAPAVVTSVSSQRQHSSHIHYRGKGNVVLTVGG